MKEVSIEQKAKRYDEALERVKELLSRCRNNRDRITMVYRVNDIESIFPEHKKSEDEKIKEDLIQWISEFPDMIWRGHYREDVITWLKRQDKSALEVIKEENVDNQKCVKSVYNVEPKFKVGDWICNDMCDVHIASIENGMYYFDEGDGLSIVFVDEHYHLWTIADARDGDVLACESGWTCIFKSLNAGDTFSSYCFMDRTKSFFETGSECHTLNEEFTKAYNDEIKPATKEQRNLLFTKMKEAGYVWDVKKKELNEIEQKPADKSETKFKAGNWYQCTKDFFGKGVTFDKNTAYYCAKEGCLQKECGCHIAIVKDLYDNFKLWTIADAKDSDVLAEDSCIFIIEKMNSNGTAIVHCCLFDDGEFDLTGSTLGFDVNSTHPATKEQRDLLFKKMEESGYEFDFEKKELKEIEQKSYGQRKECLDCQFNYAGECEGSCQMKREEQKPVWSEEDERICQCLIRDQEDALDEVRNDKYGHSEIISDLKEMYRERIDWLKSLRPHN